MGAVTRAGGIDSTAGKIGGNVNSFFLMAEKPFANLPARAWLVKPQDYSCVNQPVYFVG
ncbi:hypothetical protein ACJJIU_16095 [Microbulbifer sp. CnH-101-E]|uniref:hypothetical protein n=1 Tax=unclassified Microbulbifer TaxID=2619833 RepID=UPI00403953AD